jgi:hypothetical protein
VFVLYVELLISGSWDSSVDIATGWTAGIKFPRGTKEFSLVCIVQAGSGARFASCAMDTGDARSVKLTIHPHLIPRSRMVAPYVCSPIRLHGVVLNSLSTRTPLPFNCLQDLSLFFSRLPSVDNDKHRISAEYNTPADKWSGVKMQSLLLAKRSISSVR